MKLDSSFKFYLRAETFIYNLLLSLLSKQIRSFQRNRISDLLKGKRYTNFMYSKTLKLQLYGFQIKNISACQKVKFNSKHFKPYDPRKSPVIAQIPSLKTATKELCNGKS